MYLSCSVPVLCLLIKGRNKIIKGPFWLGKFGLVCNFVLILWTIFTFVTYAFPPTMPVTPECKQSIVQSVDELCPNSNYSYELY